MAIKTLCVALMTSFAGIEPTGWRGTCCITNSSFTFGPVFHAEVLRMATFTPSLVMGVNKDRGVIAAGKLADMVLIEGDPVRDIHDITKVATVIKGGKVYNPASIEKALGIAPRKAAQ